MSYWVEWRAPIFRCDMLSRFLCAWSPRYSWYEQWHYNGLSVFNTFFYLVQNTNKYSNNVFSTLKVSLFFYLLSKNQALDMKRLFSPIAQLFRHLRLAFIDSIDNEEIMPESLIRLLIPIINFSFNLFVYKVFAISKLFLYL